MQDQIQNSKEKVLYFNEMQSLYNQYDEIKKEFETTKKILEKIKKEELKEDIERSKFIKQSQYQSNIISFYSKLNNHYDFDKLCNNINQQIINFNNQHQQYTKKNDSRNKELINKLRETISQEYPYLELRVYGSYQTDLAMPWSDIDLVLVDNSKNLEIQTLKETENEIMNNVLIILKVYQKEQQRNNF